MREAGRPYAPPDFADVALKGARQHESFVGPVRCERVGEEPFKGVSCIVQDSHRFSPMSITVAFVCGSRSMTNTRLLKNPAMISAVATVVVDLPTPPLRLIVAIVLPTVVLLRRTQRSTWSLSKTGPTAAPLRTGGSRGSGRANLLRPRRHASQSGHFLQPDEIVPCQSSRLCEPLSHYSSLECE